jgi:hypothetical protein
MSYGKKGFVFVKKCDDKSKNLSSSIKPGFIEKINKGMDENLLKGGLRK